MTKQYNHGIEPRVEVYVATHKKIDFEIPEYCRKIQVNAERNGQWEGYLHDNDNPDNISIKNPNYCELTALYSMWKNCDADIQGLCHYRRYFTNIDLLQKSKVVVVSEGKKLLKNIISEHEIINTLNQYDLILTFPFYPYPLNAAEDLVRFCYRKDISAMCRVISSKFPDYNEALECVLNSRHLSYNNMFISRHNFVNEYCEWLFSVLTKIEKITSTDGYNTQKARVYGYLAEVLMNVYIRKHNLKCRYVYITFVKNGMLQGLKEIVKRNPFLLEIGYFLKGKRQRYISMYNSIRKFLSGDSDVRIENVTGISSFESYMRSVGFKDVNVNDSADLSYISCRLGDEMFDVIVLLFVFRQEVSEANLSEIMHRIQEVTEHYTRHEDKVIIDRIALHSGVSDRIKHEFIEAGISIAEYN